MSCILIDFCEIEKFTKVVQLYKYLHANLVSIICWSTK